MATEDDTPAPTDHPNRRSALAGLGGAATLGLTAALGGCSDDESSSSSSTTAAGDGTGTVEALDAPALDGVTADPFTLGVASGDPDASSVVLWTRLAPDPARPDGGMPAADAEVVWEVAGDDGFAELLATGTAPAPAADGHSVHVLVEDLPPDGTFRYRFRIGPYTSPLGRTRTAPPEGTTPDRMVVAAASCQDYEAGWYVAHRALAAEADLDLVLWLGDFIYEGGPGTGGVRTHDSPEVRTLADYRGRYAQYLGDADLRAARAAAPWLVIWDDHEVENNYAGLTPEDPAEAAAFADRRAAAYRAWWENQPVRLEPPSGPDLPSYRDLRWGDLVHVFALDTRQDRADQVCAIFPGVDAGPICPELDDPDQTILGDEQEQWLVDGLTGGTTTWNLVANQVVMTPVPVIGENLDEQAIESVAAAAGIATVPSLDGLRGVLADQWDGYPAQRQRVLDAMAAGPAPTVVLTGDIHASAAGPLRAVAADPGSPVVGAEFVGTSISSSNGDVGALLDGVFGPAFEYFQSERRGYVRTEFTAGLATADYVVVEDARDPDSPVGVDATFTVDGDRAFARS